MDLPLHWSLNGRTFTWEFEWTYIYMGVCMDIPLHGSLNGCTFTWEFEWTYLYVGV